MTPPAVQDGPAESGAVTVQIEFDPADYARFVELAPPGKHVGDVVVYALQIYEATAQAAKKGFTQLMVKNSKTGETMEFDASIIPNK